ncbi:MAG TPA: hypothetical protein DCL76_01700 [Chloroflexi bacterium]|nr:hypothetical protein [Chloroflexota bacterium]HCU99025.1 hypothetical protein [Chloroflexota bacterium]|tara:strand:+ start:1245 stop:1448 length:204 start_codon:yes stop_codon:yes gene_type:complete
MFKNTQKQTTILSGIIGAIFAIWLINLINEKNKDEYDNIKMTPKNILNLAMELIKTVRNFLYTMDNK